MPKYYFEIKNGHSLRDPSGLDCANDDDALLKGKVIAQKVAETARSARRQVAIHREDGVTVGEVPVRRK
jgi:sensor histidine kinase regulating citrate/malate metabolism